MKKKTKRRKKRKNKKENKLSKSVVLICITKGLREK